MPHRRHTITVATSALLFVCLMLHAQGKLYAQTPTPSNDAEAYKAYESLLPSDWTLAVAHARHLLIQAETSSYEFSLRSEGESVALQPKFSLGTPNEFVSWEDLHAFFRPNGSAWEALARYSDSGQSYITLSPVAFSTDRTIAVLYTGHSFGNLCGGGSFSILEKKEGVWKNLRWKGTSRAWAS